MEKIVLTSTVCVLLFITVPDEIVTVFGNNVFTSQGSAITKVTGKEESEEILKQAALESQRADTSVASTPDSQVDMALMPLQEKILSFEGKLDTVTEKVRKRWGKERAIEVDELELGLAQHRLELAKKLSAEVGKFQKFCSLGVRKVTEAARKDIKPEDMRLVLMGQDKPLATRWDSKDGKKEYLITETSLSIRTEDEQRTYEIKEGKFASLEVSPLYSFSQSCVIGKGNTNWIEGPFPSRIRSGYLSDLLLLPEKIRVEAEKEKSSQVVKEAMQHVKNAEAIPNHVLKPQNLEKKELNNLDKRLKEVKLNIQRRSTRDLIASVVNKPELLETEIAKLNEYINKECNEMQSLLDKVRSSELGIKDCQLAKQIRAEQLQFSSKVTPKNQRLVTVEVNGVPPETFIPSDDKFGELKTLYSPLLDSFSPAHFILFEPHRFRLLVSNGWCYRSQQPIKAVLGGRRSESGSLYTVVESDRRTLICGMEPPPAKAEEPERGRERSRLSSSGRLNWKEPPATVSFKVCWIVDEEDFEGDIYFQMDNCQPVLCRKAASQAK